MQVLLLEPVDDSSESPVTHQKLLLGPVGTLYTGSRCQNTALTPARLSHAEEELHIP